VVTKLKLGEDRTALPLTRLVVGFALLSLHSEEACWEDVMVASSTVSSLSEEISRVHRRR
jgi:hypothetical protein